MAQCKTCGKELRVETDGIVSVRAPCCGEKKIVCGKNKRKDPCGSTVQVQVDPYDSREVVVAWCSKHANDELMEIVKPPDPGIEENKIEDYELDYLPDTMAGMEHRERILTGTKKQVLAALSKDKSAGICPSCGGQHRQCDRKIEAVHEDTQPSKQSPWRIVCPKCGDHGFKYT